MRKFAAVFRDSEKDNKLVRISGLTFQKAKRMAQRKDGSAHMMIGETARSVKVL